MGPLRFEVPAQDEDTSEALRLPTACSLQL